MSRTRLVLFLFALISSLWTLSSHAESVMKVEISNIRSGTGSIYLLAFAEAKDFKSLDERALVGFATAKAQSGSLKLVLEDIPSGCCALFAFHDENNNKDLDLTAGIPVEGYAFSGGKKDGEQPDFDKAIVRTSSTNLPLIYW